MAAIVIVEDEQLLGQTFQASLADEGHNVHWSASAEAASTWLADHQVDLALVDVRLPGNDGLHLLREMAESHPDTNVIMMTAQGDVRTAVEAIKLGAADFLIKPVDLDAISLIARRNLSQRRLTQTWKHEQKRRTQKFGLHQIIGECPQIEKARAIVRRVCGLSISAGEYSPSVLITGETGTGKDLLASAFHYEGPRRDGPFVQVNCAAIPESLAESELFGHTKGAFTDARNSKSGLFEVADQGTLFLDEIGSLPLALQAKVLVAIGTGRIRAVGSVEEKPVNVHLITAMNQDPADWVAKGRLREDLYHRLRVIHVHLPPLRERGPDLDALTAHFLAMHCRKFGMQLKHLTEPARAALHAYHWPGNVRELCHRLESAVLLSGDEISADLMPSLPVAASVGRGSSAGAVGDGKAIPADFANGPVSLEAVERQLILQALQVTNHNVSNAAKLLDISRDTMRYRIEKHGLAVRRNGGAR